jgi:hypothetical protein
MLPHTSHHLYTKTTRRNIPSHTRLQDLLGDYRSFKDRYEKPITHASDKGATWDVKQKGAALAAELRSTIAPYILRREKSDMLKPTGGATRCAAPPALPALICFTIGHQKIAGSWVVGVDLLHSTYQACTLCNNL